MYIDVFLQNNIRNQIKFSVTGTLVSELKTGVYRSSNKSAQFST